MSYVLVYVMCLKFHSLPVTTPDTIKCELNGREGLEKFVVQVVYLDVVKKKHLSYPYLLSYCSIFRKNVEVQG